MTSLDLTWLCISCEKLNRGEPAHQGAWGRLCWPCWMLGAEAESEEKEEEKEELTNG